MRESDPYSVLYFFACRVRDNFEFKEKVYPFAEGQIWREWAGLGSSGVSWLKNGLSQHFDREIIRPRRFLLQILHASQSLVTSYRDNKKQKNPRVYNRPAAPETLYQGTAKKTGFFSRLFLVPKRSGAGV